MLQLHILKCVSWLGYQITLLHTLVFVFLMCKLSVLTHDREAVTVSLVWKRGVFPSCRSCSLPLNLESQSLQEKESWVLRSRITEGFAS